MMKAGIKILGVLLFGVLLQGQSQEASVDASTNEKALRYHGALLKRPSGGYLFDRFFSAWLEKGTVEELQTFLEKNAESDEAADDLLLGYFFARQGEDEKAVEVLDAVLKSEPDLVEALLTRAKIVGNSKLDFAGAVADLDKALAAAEKDTVKIEINKLKGRFLSRDSQTDEALKVWQSLLETSPDDEDLHEDVIELLSGEGLKDEAIKSAKALAAKTKDPYEKVLRELRVADLVYASDNIEGAVEAYSATLAKTGADSWIEREILTQLERVFRRKDDLEGLKSNFEKLVEDNPGRVGFKRAQARLLADLNEGDAAIEVYRGILEVTPGERTVRESYIDLLERLKRNDDATAQLRVLIDLNPKDAELELRLATLLNHVENQAEAEKAVASFLKKSDQAEFDFQRAARFYERIKNNEKAGETYDQAIAAFPESVEAKESKAAFLFQTDAVDEAIVLFKKLGSEGDMAQATRISRALAMRRLNSEAFALLKSRVDEFENDFNYLGELIAAALRDEVKTDEVRGWVRRRLLLAEGTSEIGTVLKQADQVYSEKEEREKLIAELTAKTESEFAVREACLLASTYERMAQLEDAILVLKKASENGGDDAGIALRELAEIHKRAWNFTEAAQAWETLIGLPGERNSENFKALVGLYAKGGLAKEGLKWVPEWKKLSPGSSQPWLAEAELLKMDERPDEALEVLRSASRKLDENTDVRSRLGEYYAEEANQAEAMQVYWGLYEDAEESLIKRRWVQKLHETALYQGQSERLIESFQERRRSNRGAVEPLFALAEIYRIDGEWELRRDALLEASRLQPDDIEIVKLIANSELEAGDWEAALATLDGAQTIDKTTTIVEQMARIQIEYGEAEKGYRLLAEVASKKGGAAGIDPQVIVDIGELMAKGNDWETMVDFLKGYLAEFPNDYRIAFLHATALEESLEPVAALNAFLTLAEIKTEIPAVAEKNRAEEAKGNRSVVAARIAYFERNQKQLLKVMPQEAFEFSQAIRSAQAAYQYRNSGQNYYNPSQQPTVTPNSVEASLLNTKAHVLEIIKGMDEDQQATHIPYLEKVGFPMPEVALKVALNESGGLSISDDFVAKNVADPAVCTVWLSATPGAGLHPSDDVALFEKVFATLEKDYPRMAFQTGVLLAAKIKSPESAALFEKAIALAERLEPIDSSLVMSTGQISGLQMYGETLPKNFTDEQRATLVSLVQNWYLETESAKDGGWTFWMIVRSALEDTDTDLLMKIIDKEVAADGTATQSSPFGQGLAVRPISVPPSNLVNFPQPVRLLFLSATGSQTANYIPLLGGRTELMEKIDVDEIENLQLRLLFLSEDSEREEELKKLVETSLATDPENPDLLLWSAGIAESNEDFEKAIQLLESASKLAGKSAAKTAIDGAIVNAAIKLGTDKKDANALGRKAATRLLSSTQSNPNNTSQKQTIIAAMKSLGMNSEAKRQSVALTRASQQRNSAMSVARSQQQKNTATRVDDLISKDQQDKAIGIAAKELRRIGKEASTSRGYGNWYNSLNYLSRSLSKHNLTKAVLDKMEEANGENATRWEEFGYAASLAKESGRARKAFEKLLADDPNNLKARSWLAFNLAGTSGEPEKVANLIMQAGDQEAIKTVCDLYLGESERSRYFSSQNGKGWIASREVFAAILEKFDPKADNGAMMWAVRGLQELEQSHDWGSDEIPHIHDIDPVFDDRALDSRSGKELDKQRNNAHRRLCEVMLKFPNLAAHAFTSLNPLARTDKNAAEWVAQATKILETNVTPTRSNRGYGASFSQRMPAWTPAEFLLVESYRRGDLEKSVPEIKALTEEYTAESNSDYIEGLAALLTCPADQFTESLTVDTEAKPVRVVDLWNLRELPSSELMPFIKEKIVASSPQNHYNMGWTYTFAAIAREREGIEPAEEIMESFADLFFGKDTDIEERKKRVADLYAAAKGNVSNINYQANESQFMHLLVRFAERETMLFSVFDQLKKYGYDPGYYLPYRFRNGRYANSNTNIRRFLDSAPIYTDSVADFQTVFAIRGDNEADLFSTITAKLKSNAPARKTAREVLATKPDSFGKSILTAIAGTNKTPNFQKPLLLKAVGENLDQFDKLPDSELSSWIDFIESTSGNTVSKPVESPTTPEEKAIAWLHQKGLATKAEQLTKFLGAKQTTEVEKTGRKFETAMMDLVRTYTVTDREKAKQVYRHGWNLIRQRQKTTGWDGSTSYNGWKIGAELIEDYLDENQGGLEQIGWWIELQREDKDGRFSHSGWSNDMRLGGRMHTAWIDAGGPNRMKTSVDVFLKKLHDEVGDGPVSILSLPFFDVSTRMPKGKVPQIIQECDRIAALPDAPHAELAKEWAMAARFFAASLGKNFPAEAAKRIPDPNAWQAHVLAALQDERVNLSWLVALAQHHTYRGEFAVTDEIALASADILASAMEEEADFNAWAMLHINRSFVKRQGMEGWDGIANRLRSGWWKKNRFNGRPRNQDVAFDPVRDMIASNLDLHLRMGDQTAAKRFLREFTKNTEKNDVIFAILVEYGQHAEAAQFLKKYWTNLDPVFYPMAPNKFFIRYNHKRSQAVQELLPHIKNPDLKLFAELMIEAAFDPRPEDKTPEDKIGRAKRLSLLVPKFQAHKFTYDAIRKQVLGMFLLEDHNLKLLEAELATTWDDTNISEIPVGNDITRVQLGVRAPAAHALHQLLEKNNSEPIKKFAHDIATSSGSEYYRREAFEHFSVLAVNSLKRRGNTLPPERWANYRPGFEIALKEAMDGKVHKFTDDHMFSTAYLLTAALSDDFKAVARWRNKLPENQKTDFINSTDGKAGPMLGFITQSLKTLARTPTTEVPAERRIKIMTDLLDDPTFRKGFRWLQFETTFAQLDSKKLLTKDEVLELGETLVKNWPRQGFAAAELARFETERGNYQAALKWMESAIETGGESKRKKFEGQKASIEAKL